MGKMIHRIFYPARAILLGLLTTQVLATIHVYQSDQALSGTISLLDKAGYLVIPNAIVSPSLNAIGPAFWGGLFFTFSLGAGLSLLAFVAAWVWTRFMHGKKGALLPFLLLWCLLILGVNTRRFSPMVTAYFVIVPLVVFVVTKKMTPKKITGKKWLPRFLPVIPLLLLTILWTAQADRFLFLDIRDFLLLSNPIGKKVDAFYYQYTLYPATVFKPLEQQTLKTCRVTNTVTPTLKNRVEALLVRYDYLPVHLEQPLAPVDLEIDESVSKLVFRRHGKLVFEMSPKTFFAQPGEALRRFSAENDGDSFFRQATMVGLLVGFPILLYLFVYSGMALTSGLFLEDPWSSWLAAVLSFLAGLVLLVPLLVGQTGKIEPARWPLLLRSEKWQERVAALRTIVEEKRDVAPFNTDDRFLTSPHVPERYWYAKALANSRRQEAYDHLLALLKDHHPNIVSMALDSLGRRQDKRAVPVIINHISSSKHWYNQWYAYRALRALGWRQKN